jgi:hypothetical protein
MKYLVITILLFACCNSKKNHDHSKIQEPPTTTISIELNGSPFTDSAIIIRSITTYEIMFCDSTGCIGRGVDGKWNIGSKDCNKSLDIIFKQYMLVIKERDSIRNQLNYFLKL